MEWRREKARFPFWTTITVIFLTVLAVFFVWTYIYGVPGKQQSTESPLETAMEWGKFCMHCVLPLLFAIATIWNRFRWGQARMAFSDPKPHADRLTSYHAWAGKGYFTPIVVRSGFAFAIVLIVLSALPVTRMLGSVGLSILLVVGLVLHFWRQGTDNVLVIGPEGIRVRKFFSYEFIPWEALQGIEVWLGSISTGVKFNPSVTIYDSFGRRHRVLAFPDDRTDLFRLTSLSKQLLSNHQGVQFGGKWLLDWSEALRLPTPTFMDPISEP